MASKLKTFIQKYKGITTESKESKSKPNKDIHETVCVFLNREGGIIIGIDEDKMPNKEFYIC